LGNGTKRFKQGPDLLFGDREGQVAEEQPAAFEDGCLVAGEGWFGRKVFRLTRHFRALIHGRLLVVHLSFVIILVPFFGCRCGGLSPGFKVEEGVGELAFHAPGQILLIRYLVVVADHWGWGRRGTAARCLVIRVHGWRFRANRFLGMKSRGRVGRDGYG
jgi:hypothetical protein